MFKFISWQNSLYTEQSKPTLGFEYTVFSTNLDDGNKKKLQSHLRKRTAHTLKNISLISVFILVLMISLAVLRQEFYPIASLYQFIFNIILVIGGGVFLYFQGYYELDFNIIGSFEVLDKKRKKVSTTKDNQEQLDNKIIQIFFGLLIGLSFFFTQVTLSCSHTMKKEISEKL